MKARIKQETMSNKWAEIIQEMVDLPCNRSIMSILRRVAIAACIYYIWNEKNKRLFADAKRSSQELQREIYSCVRLKLASLKSKEIKTSGRCMQTLEYTHGYKDQ